VEYKRGKAKLHRADEVQWCAQALCLEEMTQTAVPEGALFYAETKRRVVVPFDADLRSLTQETIAALAEVFSSRVTPPPTHRRDRCRACSLIELCRPDAVAKPARAWRSRMVDRLLAETEPS
jgi:CRISPR-associated exonuclease Cas4